MTYQAVFEQADDGSVFVSVPDLPGCTSWGATLDEAQEHVRDAIALWLAVARENGKDVSHDRRMQDGVAGRLMPMAHLKIGSQKKAAVGATVEHVADHR